VIGNNPLPLSTFEMQQRRDVGVMSSLVNHGTITADNVVTDLTISTGTWHFLSFPYDVKISDIATVNDWVISRYDGAARAKGTLAILGKRYLTIAFFMQERDISGIAKAETLLFLPWTMKTRTLSLPMIPVIYS
jgi:hypothetical protein